MVSETFPCSYTSPQNHSWILETLRVIIFWVRVTHKMLNVNWEKIHSIILCVTCHCFRNFPQLIHIPSYPFKTLRVIIFWVRVTHKMLNVNWEKIHSIILCVTCHGFRNFPLLIHIHSYPFKTLWVIIFWVRVTHKILNVNWEKIHSIILCVTCHGSETFPCSYTSPHIHSKPCELLFFELESLIKCWMWIGEKFTQ